MIDELIKQAEYHAQEAISNYMAFGGTSISTRSGMMVDAHKKEIDRIKQELLALGVLIVVTPEWAAFPERPYVQIVEA